ncbi:hypothetical protein TIFTF001_012359 [Ficus carica]|uniref:Uncharacterized protein n=1 Tax=Ficus carica TaxID=3494 RepID=A0AA88AN75_FICCA|nr:hypothetical protein TIFTF001_012359 [Ficus carica]
MLSSSPGHGLRSHEVVILIFGLHELLDYEILLLNREISVEIRSSSRSPSRS